MRIRSVKPEFWRSESITRLPRDVRLLFIGLWSYVDDNGVGVDDYRQIAADLFALEDDLSEVRNYVREGLATLARELLLTRYEINGKRYLHITTWDKHQRIDKPNKERYPKPDHEDAVPTSDNAPVVESIARPSRHSRETPAPGTEEQRNRGTEERLASNGGTSPAPTRPKQRLTAEELAATAQRPTAFVIVSQWRATHEPPYHRGTYDTIAQHVDALLANGADLDAIREALRMWDERGDAKPGLLPHLYDDALHMRRANAGYDRLFVNGVPVVPVEEIPDEYFTRSRLDELLGEDTEKPLGPFYIEFEASQEERKDWYDKAAAERLTARIAEAREFLASLKRKAGAAA